MEAHQMIPEPERRHRATVYLSLGSNEGESVRILATAIEQLDLLEESCVAAVSRVYRTKPIGYEDQADFLNLAVQLSTSLDPWALLASVHRLERDAGRTRENRPVWGPRPLDIDILWYDGRTVDRDRLRVPHPRMQERRFVLEPLAEIAPDLELADGRTVRQSLREVCDQEVELVGPVPSRG
ncbi:MAG: 2-amino-4-hydroxy-6-hydroxymethyldihydropteridine diphosphokinase [Thermoleophilia bacterium]